MPNESIFGGTDVVLEATLKNPNQFKQAVVFESLSTLPTQKINEFVKSDEAKYMLNEGSITPEGLEELANKHNNGLLKTTVCHMAKENGDPLWDELVRARIEERRIMNDLINKYVTEADPVVSATQSEIIDKCIPEYFRA